MFNFEIQLSDFELTAGKTFLGTLVCNKRIKCKYLKHLKSIGITNIELYINIFIKSRKNISFAQIKKRKNAYFISSKTCYTVSQINYSQT